MPALPDAQLSVRGPYEDLGIAVIGLIRDILAKMPPDVTAELWRLYLDDVREWRAFLKDITQK